jgi:predicted nucleic acid-binding protein
VSVFVDTNVLLSASDPQRVHHGTALAFLESGADVFFASPQVLREYLVVATRPPAANGQGLGVPQALENVTAFLQVLTLVFETQATWDQLRELVQGPEPVSGKRIHDANIAATALANGLDTVATFNAGDFAGFPVRTLEPGAGSGARPAVGAAEFADR